MESDSCYNGIEAMTKIRSRFEQDKPVYKLVFLDFSMPECDGPETAKQIRGFLRDHASKE